MLARSECLSRGDLEQSLWIGEGISAGKEVLSILGVTCKSTMIIFVCRDVEYICKLKASISVTL